MQLSKEEVISKLSGMDAYEFEYLIADIWEHRGWQTKVTQGSNDRGIDVIASKTTPFPQKQIIQAKRYSKGNNIGSPEVQQYSSLRQQEDEVDAVIIVTTSTFSPQARELARDLNVKLLDRDGLYLMIQESNAEDILMRYLDFSQIDTSKNGSGNLDSGVPTFETQNDGNYGKIPEILAEKAIGESVTVKKLTDVESDGFANDYLCDRPPITYFESDEQPHYHFFNESKGVKEGEKQIKNSLMESLRNSMWITDKGVHFLIGQRPEDYHRFLPYASITWVRGKTGILKHRLLLRADGTRYSFPLQPNTDDVEEAEEYIRSQARNES